jgi:3-hydroxy-9,10-secoandrosta-1,3,5(10)-triene-9,17-dione monooxygenase reductase component
MSFDERNFRDALGLFPTGVAVATTMGEDGMPAGITVNSFSSVSLRPPLVSFCAGRHLRSFAAFERAPGFALNLLKRSQADLSSRFARAGGDKWNDVAHRRGAHGGVLFDEALASFDCRIFQRFEAGDHLILIGEVVSLDASHDESPLLYFRSGYRELAGAA